MSDIVKIISMKQIFSSAVLVFSFSICAAAKTLVKELLE